jgi:hypothetical protein
MGRFEFYDLTPEAEAERLRCRAEVAALTVLRDGWRLSGILAKANFNPGEPRVPAGNGRESGRWTRNGAAGDEPLRIAEIGRRNGGGSSKPHGAVVQEAGDGVRFWARRMPISTRSFDMVKVFAASRCRHTNRGHRSRDRPGRFL